MIWPLAFAMEKQEGGRHENQEAMPRRPSASSTARKEVAGSECPPPTSINSGPRRHPPELPSPSLRRAAGGGAGGGGKEWEKVKMKKEKEE